MAIRATARSAGCSPQRADECPPPAGPLLTAVGGGARVGGAGGAAGIVRVAAPRGVTMALRIMSARVVRFAGPAARLGSVRRGSKYRTANNAAAGPGPPAAHLVGPGFIARYALAYMSTSLLFIAPLLVTLPLKVNSLVGIKQAPNSLALVAGVGALLAMVGNPFFGRMSDRTTSRLGMRRPWMVTGLVGGSLGILIVALAPSIPVVLAGWCMAQLSFNALLATMVAVLPDQ